MLLAKRFIFYFFASLLFFVPLVLWPYTSEVFEFNKMVLTYALTVLIVGTWAIRCIYEKKFIFRRTLLDIPLIIFILSQLISTLFSIDPNTSFFGYYSRFNGGFLSTLAYALLYWAFVSNITKDRVYKLLNWLLASAVLVSIYGVLEHYGIDKNIWVQDVQSRVFSTLGQPNWLAAWLVALIPLTWAFIQNQSIKSPKFWVYFIISILLFWTIIFTKSRSGLLGFSLAFATFWILNLVSKKGSVAKGLTTLAAILLSIFAIALISGTQFTPSISSLSMPPEEKTDSKVTGPALEVGGTESGTIRKIVWKGALRIWQAYPVFGTGVETFAYSYYKFRPEEHNLVSEWDFIYNKAHNEYLNMAANTGTAGLLAYLTLIGFSIGAILKGSLDKSLRFAMLSGYFSVLLTNFFGFSVVPTQLVLFLFPAISLALENENNARTKNKEFHPDKFLILILVTLVLLSLNWLKGYWKADTLYAKGKANLEQKLPQEAEKYLLEAIKINSQPAVYHNDLANARTQIALGLLENDQNEKAREYADLAINESSKAISLSPANVNLLRTRFGVFVMLTAVDKNYIQDAGEVLIAAINAAPTDAKLHYNLGLFYAQTGQPEKALETLKKTVELKTNYKDARLAYAVLLKNAGKAKEAKEQLEFILKFIDPNDSITKQTLESL